MTAAAVRALVPRTPFACLLLAVSLGAWLLLIASPPGIAVPRFCAAGAGVWPALSAGAELTLRLNPLPQFLGSSLLMLCAMMLPFAYRPLANALAARPDRPPAAAVPLFLIGFLALWLAAIVAIAALSVLLRRAAGDAGLALLLGIGIAALWQTTGFKARCVARSLRASPRRLGGELGQGAHSALACAGSCWALMLLPYLAGRAHLAAMTAVAALMLLERCVAQHRGGNAAPAQGVAHALGFAIARESWEKHSPEPESGDKR